MFRPAFSGPIKVQNQSKNMEKQLFKDLISACSFPFSLVKASAEQLTLLVTFEQPEFKFRQLKGVEKAAEEAVFVQVSEHEMPKVLRENPRSQLWLTREPTDEFVFYLNAQTSSQSHLLKLDLQSLEKVQQDFEEGNEPNFSNFAGIKASRLENSVGRNGEQLAAFQHFEITFDNLALNFKLTSSEVMFTDQTQAFVARLKEADKAGSQRKADLLQRNVPEEVDWKPPTDWIRKIRVSQSENAQDDIPMDEFKEFSTAFIRNYFAHFEKIEDVFKQRIALLEETKQTLQSKAHEARKLQTANETQRREVERELR